VPEVRGSRDVDPAVVLALALELEGLEDLSLEESFFFGIGAPVEGFVVGGAFWAA
jgi:hypothetical protein